ncbi:hypothetical protein RND71_035231 [Anisodus tanguticus]|uniref:Uncharacterized protein n=1 Tax=Anisodus tanguticus TaxID=243964 RepID=A0AAE1V210_9SOLA|nr:hypothetical protein RND71_035231 [Anisodus tanguticus]
MEPPLGFPPNSSIKLQKHEGRLITTLHSMGKAILVALALYRSLNVCFCLFKMGMPSHSKLLEKLKDPIEKTVIFCAFGCECKLKKDQFQELALGLELIGLPFFAALKPPFESEIIEEALPEGFKERTEGKGIVHLGWADQQLMLSHPKMGCFFTHCGGNSLLEAMINECQLVLVPNFGDKFINARLFGGDLKVGVEENGMFTREGVCKAIKMLMNDESEEGGK